MVYGTKQAKEGIEAIKNGYNTATTVGIQTANRMLEAMFGDEPPNDEDGNVSPQIVDRFKGVWDAIDDARDRGSILFPIVTNMVFPALLRDWIGKHEAKKTEIGVAGGQNMIAIMLQSAGQAGRAAIKDKVDYLFNAPEIDADGDFFCLYLVGVC